MKRIMTLKQELKVKTGGCGECQASCQSACKTSCTVANQSCESSSFEPKNKTRIKLAKA